LYIDGVPGGSDTWLEVAELAEGSPSVTRIALDKRGAATGGVQWDGTYVAIATGVFHAYRPRIFRVQISGSAGHVASVVRTRDMSLTSQIFLDGNTLIGTAWKGSTHLATWAYPSGGKPAQLVGRFDYITGITISK